MSTIVYAQLTNLRDAARPGLSATSDKPGLKTYADALAALVPAEALTLHAALISATTETKDRVTTIPVDAVPALKYSFYGLIALTVALYVMPRILAKKWDSLDYARVIVVALAFVGWTMLQRATVFDAAFQFSGTNRTVVALFLGAILGAAAAVLGGFADRKKRLPDPGEDPSNPHVPPPAGPALQR